MNKRFFTGIGPVALLAVTIVAFQAACNNVGDCPAESNIVPGGACNGNDLECAYTLQTPSPACAGTTAEGGLATSCICSKGTWTCPSPASCGGGEGGDEIGAGSGSGADDGGGDSAGDLEGGKGDAMSD